MIAESDAATRELLRAALGHDGFDVELAGSCAEALAIQGDLDVVIADLDMELLGPLKRRRPTTEVVVMTASACLDAALASVRDGAFDFVLKPFFVDEVSLTVACAAARRQRRDLTVPLAFIRKNHQLLP